MVVAAYNNEYPVIAEQIADGRLGKNLVFSLEFPGQIPFLVNTEDSAVISSENNSRHILVKNPWRAVDRAACIKPPHKLSAAVKHVKLVIPAAKDYLDVIIFV